MKARPTITAALLPFVVSLAVQAGPPFVTDDPEPVELRHWEVYIASQVQHASSAYNGTCPHVEINYGAAPNLQIHLIAPLAFNRPSGAASHFGYGDTEVGFKYRFLRQANHRPSIGIFPLVELPTGSRSRGLGTGHVQVFLPLWLQKDWTGWTTYGGAGYYIDLRDRSADYWLVGWEIQHDLGPGLILGGELFASLPTATEASNQLSFNIGGQINLNEENHILFSSGRCLKGAVDFTAYFAYQWTFGSI
jgi:hypothetical protein